MNFIILAAGEATRWNGGEPKQLLVIEGRRLIDRTILQFSPYGEVHVVTSNDSIMECVGGRAFTPKRNGTTAETLYSARGLWGKRTVVLLGDVAYTKDAVQKIVDYDGELTFFTDCHDIFAISFSWNRLEKMLIACAIAAQEEGRLWQVYQNCGGFPDWPPPIDPQPMLTTLIGDETQDFDIVENYMEFIHGKFKNRIYNESKS